ncbi:MAG: DMT family transporter [Pseudomonadota bacterium]
MSAIALISQAPPRVRGNIAAFIAMVFWATGFPAVAIILETWHPLLLAPARFGLAAVALLVFTVLATGPGSLRQLTQRTWRDIWWIGGGLLMLSTVLLLYGQSLVHPVTVSVIISMLPLHSALAGMIAGTERMTLVLAFGIFLSLVGGVIVSVGPDLLLHAKSRGVEVGSDATADTIRTWYGPGFVLAGVVLFVAYSRACDQRLGMLGGAGKAGLTMAAGTVVVSGLALAAVMGEIVPAQLDLSPSTLMLIFWLGFGAIAASMALWFTAIRLTGMTITAMHHNLVPFYVIVLSLAGGGVIALHHWLGAGLVVLGAIVAQLGPDWHDAENSV